MSDSPNPLAELEKLAQRISELAMDSIYSAFEWAQDPRDSEWEKLSVRIYDDALETLREPFDRLTADCARKDAALEPFGSALADCEDANQPWPDSWYIWELSPALLITVAHLRAAASARGEGGAVEVPSIVWNEAASFYEFVSEDIPGVWRIYAPRVEACYSMKDRERLIGMRVFADGAPFAEPPSPPQAPQDVAGLVAALTLAEDVLSRAPFSTQIWPNGMHPNKGIEIIRNAITAALTPRELTDEEAERGAREIEPYAWEESTEDTAYHQAMKSNLRTRARRLARAAYRAITEEPAR